MSAQAGLNRELVFAVRGGKVEEAERLLSEGATPNAWSDLKHTVVMIASSSGYKSILQLLLEKQADVNTTCEGGWTALILAAVHGNDEIVDMLIKANADVCHKTMVGETAYDWATKEDNTSTAGRLLLGTGTLDDVSVEGHPLVFHWACKNRKGNIARRIVERGTDWKDNGGRTPLDIAAFYDNMDMASIILDKAGSTPLEDLPFETCWLVLKWACKNRRSDVSTMILEQGTESKDKSGHTLLLVATEHGMYDEVDVLLKNRADTEATDVNGDRAVTLAIKRGNMSIAARLLMEMQVLNLPVETIWQLLQWSFANRRVDVAEKIARHETESIKDESERSLLHYAVQHCMHDAVDILIRCGPNSDKEDCNGDQPIVLAMRNGDMSVACRLSLATCSLGLPVQMLWKLLCWAYKNKKFDVAAKIAKQQDQSTKDQANHTVLHVAALQGLYEVTDFLLENGANANATDKNGDKAISVALQRGNMSVAGRLVLATHTLNLPVETLWQLFYWAFSNNKHDVAARIVKQEKDAVKDESGCTLLHVAVNRGIRGVVEFLLENGADPDATDKNGDKAVAVALRRGDMSTAGRVVLATHKLNLPVIILWRLLSWCLANRHIDVAVTIAEHEKESIKDNSGRTLLHIAAYHGTPEVVDLLLESGADADAPDENGVKAVHLAVEGGHLPTAGRLVLATRSLDDLPFESIILLFRWTCERNQLDIVRKLLRLEIWNKHGTASLNIAAVYQNMEVADIILNDGLRSSNGETRTVMTSIEIHQTETLCLLLYWAHNKRRDHVTATIFNKCKDVQDTSGRTILHYAAYHGVRDVVHALLTNRANADVKDKNGDKAVVLALRNGHMALAGRLALSTRISDLSTKNLFQLLSWACKREEWMQVATKVAEQHSRSVLDKSGRVLLHYAAEDGLLESVDLLLEKDANVNDTDKDGRSAFDLAMSQDHMYTAALLTLATNRMENLPLQNLTRLLRWACRRQLDAVAVKIGKLKDKYGRTLVHYAAESKVDVVDVVDLLLENNADASCKDKDGTMPYELASGSMRRRLKRAATKHNSTLRSVGYAKADVCLVASDGAGRAALLDAYRREFAETPL